MVDFFNKNIERLTKKERLIYRYLKDYEIKFDYRTNGFYILSADGHRTGIPIDKLSARLYVDLHDKGLGKDILNAVLLCIMSGGEEKALEETRSYVQRIEQIPEEKADAELWKWIQTVCREGHELSFVVMRHWIWLVKRKILGLPITNPICPVLQGQTDAGKTTAVRKLTEPLKTYTRMATLRQISDDREWRTLLGRFFIVFLDEMSQSSRASLETLKMVISAETLDPRILGLNATAHITVNSSFIGTSNPRVRDVIHDSTTASRYWEVRCKSERFNWSVIDSLDYEAIWACGRSSEPSHLSTAHGVRLEILALQQKNLRHKESFELWEDDLELMPVRDPKYAKTHSQFFVPTAKLYESYKHFCVSGNFRIENINVFGGFLRARGYPGQRRRIGGAKTKQIRGVMVFCTTSVFNAHQFDSSFWGGTGSGGGKKGEDDTEVEIESEEEEVQSTEKGVEERVGGKVEASDAG